MRRTLIVLALAMAFTHSAPSADDTVIKRGDSMKIRLTVGDKLVTAMLNDSQANHDFISLLPLTLKMNDLFGREKFAHLPRAISEEGQRTHTYRVGAMAYWPPNQDLATYYHHDGEKIPDPGIIVIGKIHSGTDALNVVGSVKVTLELITK